MTHAESPSTAATVSIDEVFNDKRRLRGFLDDIDVHLLWAACSDLPAGAWNHDGLPDDFWRLYQNNADGGTAISNDRPCPLAAGAVYIVPSGVPLSSRNSAHFRQFFIHFDLRGVPPFAFKELFPGPVLVPDVAGFYDAVDDLGDRINGQGFDGLAIQCRIKGTVYEAFGHYLGSAPVGLIENSRSRMTALAPVVPALQLIEERFDAVIRNADLASVCNLSEDYFIHKFRNATGLTPTAYIRKRRVSMGAQMLLFSDDSIDAIAAKTGFTDRFYFSRVFTKETGCPPAAYRRGPRT